MAGTLTVQNIEGPSSGANANKVIIPSGQTLYAPGHVVQVVTKEIATVNIGTTSTSLVDVTGSSLSITPSSANSKILLTSYLMIYATTAAAPMWTAFYDVNNATTYSISSLEAYNSSAYNGTAQSAAKLLTPNSTETQNYKLQFGSYNARLVYINAAITSAAQYKATSYFIATEIAG